MSRFGQSGCRLLLLQRNIQSPRSLQTASAQIVCRWASSSSSTNSGTPSTEELLRKVYAAQQQQQAAPTPPPSEPNTTTESAARKGGFGPFPQPENPSASSSSQAGPKFRSGPSAGPTFKEPTSFKVQRFGRNLVSFSVFGAGLLLTLTIVYSFSTEVLASGSATSVFNHCTPLLQASDELHSVLRSPLTFHGTPPQLRTRRNHHIASTLVQRPDGTQEMRVKFWVDGAAKSDPSESLWEKAKRTVFRPIIVEPINHPAPPQAQAEQQQLAAAAEKRRKQQQDQTKMTWGDWFKSGFAAIIPTSNAGPGGALKTSSSSGYPMKPQLGAYETGEVSAALIRASDGSFQLKTLVVDFREPGKHPWRVNVVNKSDAQVIQDHEVEKQKGWLAQAKALVGLESASSASQKS